MELAANIIVIIAGIYQIGFGLSMHTENFRSSLIFKVIPFLLGCGCLWAGLKGFGVI